MLTRIACAVGGTAMIIGAAGLLGVISKLLAEVWIQASLRWRAICMAESLIVEYKREREEYLRWKADKEENNQGKEEQS